MYVSWLADWFVRSLAFDYVLQINWMEQIDFQGVDNFSPTRRLDDCKCTHNADAGYCTNFFFFFFSFHVRFIVYKQFFFLHSVLFFLFDFFSVLFCWFDFFAAVAIDSPRHRQRHKMTWALNFKSFRYCLSFHIFFSWVRSVYFCSFYFESSVWLDFRAQIAFFGLFFFILTHEEDICALDSCSNHRFTCACVCAPASNRNGKCVTFMRS